jgi:hypothetical protein
VKKAGKSKEELRQKWEQEQAEKRAREEAGKAKRAEEREKGGERKRYYSSSDDEKERVFSVYYEFSMYGICLYTGTVWKSLLPLQKSK